MTIAERIAALPVAVNTAADFSGKLTQGTSSPVSAGKSSTEKCAEYHICIGSCRLYERRCIEKAVAEDEYC